MKILAALIVSAASCVRAVVGDFNQCLGVEISRLPEIDNCSILYDACQIGVSKLNVQLKMPMNKIFHPVSIVSATESKAKGSKESMVAMLVQLAPIERCVHKFAIPISTDDKCTFDMAKMEIYSILLRQDKPSALWSLDGYKHHALSDEDRRQIVTEYKNGNFYGSNLAIGIFDTPNLPAEAASDSSDSKFTRSPVALFAVIASATVSIGLLFHHRRRLHNGYAPIVILKRGQLQAKNMVRPSARPREPSATSEEISLKQEATERYAV